MDLLISGLLRERWAEFEEARRIYNKLIAYRPKTAEATFARERLAVLETLIAEKKLYERIHEQAKSVLTDIGVNIAECPEILHILMDADAIDFNKPDAELVPLKADYIEHGLESVPREMPGDPGPNAFGTGGTPPFFRINGDHSLRPASAEEFRRIVSEADRWSNVVELLSVPVQTEKTMSDFDCARCMEKGFSGLKMISTKTMSNEEAGYFSGKEDWLDGTSLMTALKPMPSMVNSFCRSIRSGNNLLLLDLSIAGASGPNTPEALLTHIHAQVLFMMILAQTIRPGTLCVHGGIPGVVNTKGDLSYSAGSQALINEAMARLNLWVTGFPSAQSGGSTSLSEDTQQAIEESKIKRDNMRRYGTHILRHAFGALGNLNYFSLYKFVEDCKAETESRAAFRKNALGGLDVLPNFLPGDDDALAGIQEMAEQGSPMQTNHTLRNIDAFRQWEDRFDLEKKRRSEKEPQNGS
ncbi:MAG: trimethylamine methyltransferase family protein [Desulfohalobiaceae bacterium]|nr:trimethylamine methyltransferase family protein [Desulfohalobiaceae bacterium]